MTAIQMGITIAVCTAATMLTRFFALCGVFVQGPAAAGGGAVSGAGAARRHLWHADRLLPQERDSLCGQPRCPGGHCAAGDRCPAQMEARNAAQRGGRHPVLCAAGAAGVLIGKSSPVMALCHGRRSFLLSDRRYRSSPDGRSAAAAGRSCRSSGPAATCSW